MAMFMSSLRAFYPLDAIDCAGFVNHFCRQPDVAAQAVWDRICQPHAESESVIDGLSKVLLAAKVAFCSLHRRVAQQKLDLLKFAATRVT
jgi:hypothetical protein